MSAMKIQLAIQGGGAKLITLLGAGSAIQELQAAKRIQLTRVIGTSAGSMVAAMLAANINITDFKNELKKGDAAKLARSLPEPSKRALLKTFLLSRPMVSSSVLEGILRKVFSGAGFATLEDIYRKTGTELRIVAADLSTGKPYIYQPSLELEKSTEIVTSLMASAGIPLYFKTWKHGTLVDGGLVLNFPWEMLTSENDGEDKGKILGISFAEEKTGYATVEDHRIRKDPLKGRAGYTKQLLNTALDFGTELAKKRLGPERVLSLPQSYETFDFKRAFDEGGLGDHFNRAKNETAVWFEQRLAQAGILIDEDLWKSSSLPVMETLGRMYKQQHQESKIKYRSCLVEVYGHGLRHFGEPDVVTYSFEFDVLEERLYCHSIALTQSESGQESFKQSQITLTGPDGEEIPTEYVPVVDRTTQDRREILILFSKILPVNTGPYRLVVTDVVKGLLSKLQKSEEDFFVVSPSRTCETTDRIELVLHLPNEYSSVNFASRSERETGQITGHEMDEGRLSEYRLRAQAALGLGWVTKGWVGEDVRASILFGPTMRV